MPDLYSQNGFILRYREIDDGISELELTFPTTDRQQALAYSLALVYLALYRRELPFVASSATLKSVAVRTRDLDTEDTRQAFIDAIELVRREVTRLLADAEIYLFGNSDKGVLETDPEGSLKEYRRAEFVGKRFLERFAQGLELSKV